MTAGLEVLPKDLPGETMARFARVRARAETKLVEAMATAAKVLQATRHWPEAAEKEEEMEVVLEVDTEDSGRVLQVL